MNYNSIFIIFLKLIKLKLTMDINKERRKKNIIKLI